MVENELSINNNVSLNDQFNRTALLYGNSAVNTLSQCRVAVFGIGGVGGYVCEALIRSADYRTSQYGWQVQNRCYARAFA